METGLNSTKDAEDVILEPCKMEKLLERRSMFHDGRFRALLARFLLMMFFDGTTKSFGVVVGTIVTSGHLPYRTAGWVLTWQLATCFMASPIVTLLLRSGSSRAWGIFAGVCVGTGFIGLGYATTISLWLMLLMTSISGVVLIFLRVITVHHLWDKFCDGDYATAYAVSSLGTNVGVSLFPLTLHHLELYQGTRGATTLMGGVLLNTIVVAMLASPRTPTSRRPDGSHSDLGSNSSHKNEKYDSAPASSGREQRWYEKFDSWALDTIGFIRRNPSFPLFLVLSILVEFSFVTWALYLVPYGESIGMSRERAVYLPTIGGAAGLLGKLCLVVAARFESLNALNVFAVPSLVIAVSYIVTFLWESFGTFAVAALFGGFCIGLQGSGKFAMVPHVVQEQDFRQAIGWLLTGYTLSALSGGIISGLLRDLTGSFSATFALVSSACLLNSLLALIWWIYS